MIYAQLVWSFLQIGLFSVGGGYAAMPLIQVQTVDVHAWLTMREFSDLVILAEMTPGPIALNAATFVGMRTAGIAGALAATFGCILPSCVLVSLLAYVYKRYHQLALMQSVLSSLRPVVVALIASAAFSIARLVVWNGASVEWLGCILFAAAFFALRKLRWHPILTMALCGAAYLAAGLIWDLPV